MSETAKDGGPAFPKALDPYPNMQQAAHGHYGMSLRDWFAGQALPAVIEATSAGQHFPVMQEGEQSIRFAIARDAYDMADAMLAARARATQEPNR